MDVGKQGLVSVSCGLLYGNRWGCEYMAVSNVIDVVTKSSVVMLFAVYFMFIDR